MISASYKPIFRFRTTHSFFTGGVCVCFAYAPDTVTKKCLEKYGFMVRYLAGGFDLFVSSDNSLESVFKYIENVAGVNSFDFKLSSTDPNFLIYTDLPAGEGTLMFDTGADTNKFIDGKLLLAPSVQNETTLSITLTIRFIDILKYRGEDGSAYAEVNFISRSTQWRYYIVNRSSLNLNNPAISSKEAIQFNKQPQVEIPTGEQALLFTSEEKLPLSEHPEYVFSLVDNHLPAINNPMKKGKIVFKGLPNPGPQNTSISQDAGLVKAWSTVYVYI